MSRITSILLASALTAALAAPTASFAQSSATTTATVSPLFEHLLKKLDTNGDGKISLAEWQAGATARFDAIDTQGTGQITAEQLANASAGKPREEKFAEHEVQKIGSNGVITKEQFLAASQARFAKLDKNGDGFLTADEVPAGHWGGHKGGANNPQQ